MWTSATKTFRLKTSWASRQNVCVDVSKSESGIVFLGKAEQAFTALVSCRFLFKNCGIKLISRHILSKDEAGRVFRIWIQLQRWAAAPRLKRFGSHWRWGNSGYHSDVNHWQAITVVSRRRSCLASWDGVTKSATFPARYAPTGARVHSFGAERWQRDVRLLDMVLGVEPWSLLLVWCCMLKIQNFICTVFSESQAIALLDYRTRREKRELILKVEGRDEGVHIQLCRLLTQSLKPFCLLLLCLADACWTQQWRMDVCAASHDLRFWQLIADAHLKFSLKECGGLDFWFCISDDFHSKSAIEGERVE